MVIIKRESIKEIEISCHLANCNKARIYECSNIYSDLYLFKAGDINIISNCLLFQSHDYQRDKLVHNKHPLRCSNSIPKAQFELQVKRSRIETIVILSKSTYKYCIWYLCLNSCEIKKVKWWLTTASRNWMNRPSPLVLIPEAPSTNLLLC